MAAAAAREAAETAARASYGRLVAYLAARSRDVAAAEDAVAEAFAAALATWPDRGVPDDPDAWLFAAARRRLLDARRRDQTRAAAAPAVALLAAERAEADGPPEIPDERLKLMFACAHPAIDPGVRAPLMLQTVLGLDAARIGSAFLVKPAAMGQRLSRAKAKIKAAGVPFQIPAPAEAPARMEAVLEAVYAAYGAGWDDAEGADPRRRGLSEEAIWLGRLCAGLAPEDPEAGGLVALMLHCEARRAARRDAAGAYVPLDAQDVGLWDMDRIAEAEAALRAALAAGAPGRFQLEAAIQSAHAWRAVAGRADWPAIAALYDRLLAVAPSLGAFVSRAAALGAAAGAAAGLTALDEIPSEQVEGYQPYWATRAHLAAEAGHLDDAAQAYEIALGMTEDAAVRDFLTKRAALLRDRTSAATQT